MPHDTSPDLSPPENHARRVLLVCFVLWMLVMVWAVLWKIETPWTAARLRDLKLVPLVATAEAGASAPIEVVENVLLFVPVGLFLGMLAPRWPWWRAGLVAAGTSIALESAQYVLATGASDVTDVLGNTAGALLGLGLLALARRRLGERTGRVLTRCAVAGTAFAVVLATALVASPLHLTPQDTGTAVERAGRVP